MRRVLATAIMVGCTFPAAAQVALPDSLASVEKCTVEAAKRYAVLDASLGDVADAAVASCQQELDAFRPPKMKWERPDETLQAMDRFEARLRSDALAAAANARLSR